MTYLRIFCALKVNWKRPRIKPGAALQVPIRDLPALPGCSGSDLFSSGLEG